MFSENSCEGITRLIYSRKGSKARDAARWDWDGSVKSGGRPILEDRLFEHERGVRHKARVWLRR